MWVTWIFGAVLHRLVVVVMFENELLVIDVEAAEIMLVVRIVVGVKSSNVLVRSIARALTSSGRALTAAVIMMRPPVNDLRKRSLRVRILALFRRVRDGMGDFRIAFLPGGERFGKLGR